MKIVIDGAGEIGSHLAVLFAREGNEISVIDRDKSRLEKLTAMVDVEPIHGDPTSLQALSDAKTSKADLFIAVYPHVEQEVNIVAALFAKSMGAKKVVARTKYPEILSNKSRNLLKSMGLDLPLCPEKIASEQIIRLLRYNNTSSDAMDFAQGNLHISTFKVDEDSPILDTKLIDFTKHFTEKENRDFRVLAIFRDSKTIIPKFDTKFKYGDSVYIAIKKEGEKSLNSYLGLRGISVSNIMIMGGGTVGQTLAKSLSEEVASVKLIELDKDRCTFLASTLPNTINIINGDGRNSDFLYEQGLNTCDTFVALTGNDEANILACVTAKKFGVYRTVAEVENMEYVRLAEEMGIDIVINKKLVTASRIHKLTLGDKARFVRYLSGIEAEVMEYTAAEGSPITKKMLKDVDFPEDAVIGGIMRGNEAFIAVGDSIVKAGDRVAVFTLSTCAKEVGKLFS